MVARWSPQYAGRRPASGKKQSGNAGKTFEQQLRAAFSAQPSVWVKRFTDSLTLRPDADGQMVKYHAPTPPDLIVVLPGAALLVECKAVRLDLGRRDPMGTPVALSRLPRHQWDDLLAFDRVGPWTSGVVAVLFYNGLLGAQRVYRAWLVPISFWDAWGPLNGRASIPMLELARQLPGFEVEWVPSRGGWQVTDVIERLLRFG